MRNDRDYNPESLAVWLIAFAVSMVLAVALMVWSFAD
jgi:hypothetical protein